MRSSDHVWSALLKGSRAGGMTPPASPASWKIVLLIAEDRENQEIAQALNLPLRLSSSTRPGFTSGSKWLDLWKWFAEQSETPALRLSVWILQIEGPTKETHMQTRGCSTFHDG